MICVYISRYPFDLENKEIYPEQRAKEIADTRNPSHKEQKYYVWKLLERAVSDRFGKKLSDFTFIRSENGRWECDGFYFSLSHTDGVVSVAVSDSPCGVDTERFELKRFNGKLAKKILNETEYSEYTALRVSDREEFLIRKWTEKESIFKMLSENVFIPNNIDTKKYCCGNRFVFDSCTSCSYGEQEEIEYIIM